MNILTYPFLSRASWHITLTRSSDEKPSSSSSSSLFRNVLTFPLFTQHYHKLSIAPISVVQFQKTLQVHQLLRNLKRSISSLNRSEKQQQSCFKKDDAVLWCKCYCCSLASPPVLLHFLSSIIGHNGHRLTPQRAAVRFQSQLSHQQQHPQGQFSKGTTFCIFLTGTFSCVCVQLDGICEHQMTVTLQLVMLIVPQPPCLYRP